MGINMKKRKNIDSKYIIFGEVVLCLLLFFIYFIRQAGKEQGNMMLLHEVKEKESMALLEEAKDKEHTILQQEGKKIALTFDDGPHPQFTEPLLDGLKERGIQATFFVTGEHAKLHPDIIERMKKEGHVIGNHTYSHMQLTQGNRERFKEELMKTNEILAEITGEEVIFVRPPYGTWDKSFETELNMIPVMWNVDPLDWCSNDASAVVSRVIKEAEENAIILMHDYYESSVAAALQIVDELQKKGYLFVTVEEILFD